MNNQNIIIENTKKLLSIRCYEGLKTAANEWLEAIGTENEKQASEKYVAVLEDSIVDIDTVISLFTSASGIERFGPENASQIANHAKEIKANGAKWCDCPACTAAMEVLKYKEDLLA
ncbi:hypothetical protein H0486_13870 [Lachnospiraceae bacterium MD1]|jgi:hypothetical protein|uniref:Molecular chaperone Hsp90 n=1 Tax=Variimorphobacter saccharofermentans TaxID=2755051 RepID=A0A839K222_9FIRM|nr:hypothetical protein [Variimorphobacter saccharofermentans]MBB2183963.1 hypothetical protein [Variimorphobacter saccharofermentans]